MIRHSSNTIVGGPSGYCKFTWSVFLRHADALMHPPPRAKQYCYRAWKPAFDEVKKMDVTFPEGLPATEDLE